MSPGLKSLNLYGPGPVVPPGDGGRRSGLEVAGGVPAGGRLVDQPRAVLVLGADREVRIEERRPLPPQHLQCPAAAALGRLVDRHRLGHRHARNRQELGRHRRRQPDRHHPLHEAAPRKPARLHITDQSAQFTFVHETLPSPCLSPFPPDALAILQDACKSQSEQAAKPSSTMARPGMMEGRWRGFILYWRGFVKTAGPAWWSPPGAARGPRRAG